MRISALTPMLWTCKLKETIEFYTTILRFTCLECNEKWGWVSISKDDLGLMIAEPFANTDFVKPFFTGSFCFVVEDIDELWHNLKDKVQICYYLEDFETGMRDFTIYDNNGYILQFGQAVFSDIES